MTLSKRDVCARLGVSSNKEYGRIVNLARYYKKHDRLADHKRIRPLENRVLSEAGFFDEKPGLLEAEDPDLVVLTSNIAFKFAGQTSGGHGLTLLEHARKRRHDEQAAAQALEPEPTPEPPEPEPPEPEPPWSDELRVVFQNEW